MYKRKSICILIIILLSSLTFLTSSSKEFKVEVRFDGTTFVLDNYNRKKNMQTFISVDNSRVITVREEYGHLYFVIDGKNEYLVRGIKNSFYIDYPNAIIWTYWNKSMGRRGYRGFYAEGHPSISDFNELIFVGRWGSSYDDIYFYLASFLFSILIIGFIFLMYSLRTYHKGISKVVLFPCSIRCFMVT